jgi:flagellar motor switch protein FliN/FliY
MNITPSESPNPTEAAQAPMPAEPIAQTRGPARPTIDGLSFVMDVPVKLTVEIGRKKARIAEILKVERGSVLELDKASGEPLDIYVNDRLVARGEAVVVGERYGVRVLEVLVENLTGATK